MRYAVVERWKTDFWLPWKVIEDGCSIMKVNLDKFIVCWVYELCVLISILTIVYSVVPLLWRFVKMDVYLCCHYEFYSHFFTSTLSVYIVLHYCTYPVIGYPDKVK